MAKTEQNQTQPSRQAFGQAPGKKEFLGKYFCTLSLYDYTRQNPFSSGVEESQAISNGLIFLPLPIQLYDRTASAFSQQNLGVVGDLFNLDLNLGSLLLRGLEPALQGGVGILSMLGSRKLNPTGGRPSAKAEAGLIALNKLSNAVDVSAITTSVQQLLGVVPNPNPVVKFVGPQLRSFNYTWYLSPKNKKESENLAAIIKKLKAASLAGRSGDSNALLTIPKLVQMNFYPWDRKNDGSVGDKTQWGWTEKSIIKMKRCHMSNVSVNYNPANVPAFFYDNNPVIVELSIELIEVEYMFEEDWESLSEDKDLSDVISSTLTSLGLGGAEL